MTIRIRMISVGFAVVTVVATMMLAVGPALAVTTNTWNGSVSSTASVDGNWSLNHTPLPAEAILLDGTSSTNMIWDAAASSNVAAWLQTAAYAGTVTVMTVYQASGFTNLTVAGDLSLSGGAWTHPTNSAGETNRLCVSVGGNFFISNATINVDGKGYAKQKGPGGNTSYSGATHGGVGGDFSGLASRNVYGSIASPTNLGSAANGVAGGGAVILSVAGTSTVAGVISANGTSDIATDQGGGAGGSVFLTTGWLTGNGTIRANGGGGHAHGGAGGGGRVAVILTDAGATFSNWTGTNTAWSGNTGPINGAAGTVYLRTGAGVDTLIVDNDNRDVNNVQVTTLMLGVNLNAFSSVVIKGKGMLGITTNTTLDFGTANIVTNGATNSYIYLLSDTNVAYPANWMIDGYTLYADGLTKTLTNVTIGGNGAMTHSPNIATELYKVRLTLMGNLTVLSNGAINVDSQGYGHGQGPGGGGTPSIWCGGTYGGVGADGSTNASRNTYGSIFSPTNLGSGGNFAAGGGAVILSVAGTSTVAGVISAVGNFYNWGHGGGAGGSIFLTSGWLTGNGTLRANGGNGGYGGGGGRVAIVLTGTGADFGNWTGTNTAFGGINPCAAGTVYLAAASAVAGGGRVIVDNNNVATNVSYTPLPAFSNSVENLRASQWTLQSKARVVLVTNAAIESLTINTNSYLELGGFTLMLNTLTITNHVIRGGTYTASQLGPLVSDSSGGLGKVVIPTRGTLFFIQ